MRSVSTVIHFESSEAKSKVGLFGTALLFAVLQLSLDPRIGD
jgi:hypothetical protein